jgi:hypothetical protein
MSGVEQVSAANPAKTAEAGHEPADGSGSAVAQPV